MKHVTSMKTFIGFILVCLITHNSECTASSAHRYPDVKDVNCKLIMYSGESTEEGTEGPGGWNCYPERYDSGRFYGVPMIPLDVMDEIENGARWVRIHVPDESNEQLKAWEPIPDSAQITIIQEPLEQSRRSTQRKIGINNVVVVRVIALDRVCSYSKTQLSDYVFGTGSDPVNLASQYDACSKGVLNFVPKNHSLIVNGATDLNINMNVTRANKGTVRAEIEEAFIQKFGSLHGFDHIMYCFPPGTLTNGGDGWVAWANINDEASFFDDVAIHSVTNQMHEVGHNLGLRHSGTPNSVYGDGTCIMGSTNTWSNGPLKCFNGPKTYELGWFSECHTLISNWTTSVTVYLLSASLYTPDNCNASQAVTVAISKGGADNFFVFYNKATGPSAGVDEKINQVTIATGNPARDSTLLKGLSAQGESVHTTSSGAVRIKFCGVVSGTARVGIGRNDTSDLCA